MTEPADDAVAPHTRSLASHEPAQDQSKKDGEDSVSYHSDDDDENASAASFESTDDADSVQPADPPDIHPPAKRTTSLLMTLALTLKIFGANSPQPRRATTTATAVVLPNDSR